MEIRKIDRLRNNKIQHTLIQKPTGEIKCNYSAIYEQHNENNCSSIEQRLAISG